MEKNAKSVLLNCTAVLGSLVTLTTVLIGNVSIYTVSSEEAAAVLTGWVAFASLLHLVAREEAEAHPACSQR